MDVKEGDPFLSGVFDSEYIKTHHEILDNIINEQEWSEFEKVNLPSVSQFPIIDRKIIKWAEKTKSKEASVEKTIKNLIYDIDRIWGNYHYQIRFPLINESTYTHDIIAPILKFVAPSYFNRFEQAQSLSAKGRGIVKYVDVIGNVQNNDHLFEVFFLEVSHGPFHQSPEQHIDDDRYKLFKLGKDSIDRNGKHDESNNVLLFHFYSDYLCVYLMDYKFYPVPRKIPLEKARIPLFLNTMGKDLLDFVKFLWKYRCILDSLYEKYLNFNVSKRLDVHFKTQITPQKKQKNK